MTRKKLGRRDFMAYTSAPVLMGSALGAQHGAGAQPQAGPRANQGKRYGAFRGMMPIMATPVDNEYKVDLASQRRHVEYCIQCGAVAVGHFAYASEFMKISDADRTRLLEVVTDQVDGRVPFFAGVTGKTSADTLRYAREAEEKGADLLLARDVPFVVETADGLLAITTPV